MADVSGIETKAVFKKDNGLYQAFYDDFVNEDNWVYSSKGTWSIDASQMKCIPSITESATRTIKTTSYVHPDLGDYIVQCDFKVSDKTKCTAGFRIAGRFFKWYHTTGKYLIDTIDATVQPTFTNDTYQTWKFIKYASGVIEWYVDGVLIHSSTIIDVT